MKDNFTLSSIEGTWRFNDNVAKNFDKHVNQSIPHYKDLQLYISALAEWFIKDGSVIYDLGCSTGESIKNICKLNTKTKFEIIGLDSSKKMIDLAKKKLNLKKLKKEGVNISLKTLDILKIKKFKKSDLFLSVLLFPFINIHNREKIMQKIYKSLNPGGGFILVEKIRSSDPQFEDILNQLYFDFKLRQNLSESEILKKAKSLRSSMFLFNEKKNTQLIKKIGFNNYEIFFKCFNFIGYIIIK